MTSVVRAIKNNNGWTKFILGLLIPIVLGSVGFGVLKSDVRHNTLDILDVERDIERSEERLYDRLDRIEDKVDQLLQRP